MLLAVENSSVLRRLAQDPAPESIQDLADAVGRHRQNVSRSLASLEAEGLVHLVTVDGKRRHELTSEGRDLLPRLDVLEGKRRPAADALELVLSEVEEDPLNPRKSFAEDGLEDMADSIELRLAQGQPPLILPMAVKATTDPFVWRIVDGARRRRAIEIVELRGKWPLGQTFSAVIREPNGDLDQELTSLVANVQREDMNPIEEAHAIERQVAGGRKVGELAQALGKTRRFVEKRRQLLKLPEILQIEVARGVTSIEKALAHVQEHRAAEPQAPAPQAAAGAAGPNLTPAQALIMIEVAIATEQDDVTHSDLGPSARTPKPVDLTKHKDAQALMAAGLLAFWGQWPSVVSILKPGMAWLQEHGAPNVRDKLRPALEGAGVMSFEIEALEAEDRYHTPWLNEAPKAKPKPAPEISDLCALILLELEDSVSKAPSYYADVRPDVDRQAVQDICGDMVGFQGPRHQDGIRYAWTSGERGRALDARWPGVLEGGQVFADALAEVRAKLLPAKDLKLLEKRGGYATPWLNSPFEPDPEWLAARERDTEIERKRAAEKAEQEEWRAGVTEAIDVFETEALDMTEAQIRPRFVELLAKASASAPWRLPEPIRGARAYAKTADHTYCIMDGSPNARRLAILAVNIAAGIPAKEWPQPAEDEDLDRAEIMAAHPMSSELMDSMEDEDEDLPTRACAGCGVTYLEQDLDDDGACADCVAAEEADADAQAASVEG